MEVSVVIPVYNEEKYIKKYLDSLMVQSEKPDEIIVVDNNCTDKTINIVKKYPEIKIIKEKKQGITPARNAGFNAASGDILVKCDADSILPPNWLKKIKQVFIKKKGVVGITIPVIFYDTSFISCSVFPYYLYMYFSKIVSGYYLLVGPSLIITRIVWEKVKNELCIDEKKIHEDIDLSFHIKKYGEIYLDPENIIKVSGRRIKYNPLSFFIEYPIKYLKMLIRH